jgi:hypothetical protein
MRYSPRNGAPPGAGPDGTTTMSFAGDTGGPKEKASGISYLHSHSVNFNLDRSPCNSPHLRNANACAELMRRVSIGSGTIGIGDDGVCPTCGGRR